ncbi:glycosyl hydrolase family 18 protein [Cytobacillus oceanisediminis]|uniref:glycosyl hydrolase family 18 protein n=1 Tax=Cytobacillus oceanisediminis TaxID=665099 RepID=UPI001FB31693|nr:glycosyl hydrolase family 18 protein [Cytobacillus oceanisediminis]
MKRIYQMLIIIVLIFSSGFAAGIYYTNNTDQLQPLKQPVPVSQSSKLPVKKGIPELSEIPEKVLMGYVQDYRDPNSIDYSNLSHILFSFAHPEKDGSISLNGDSALENLRSVVRNAHEQDVKALLAVGGWFHINGGESYDYFKQAIADDSSRDRLVKELAGLAQNENLDGIDIDFEHPRSKEDAKYLAVFINKLSEVLHSNGKVLSVAVHAKIHSVTGTETGYVVYEPAMFQKVDYVNIMAYDGQWDGGYNAANLSPYSFTENIANYWGQLFDSQGIPKDKLVLGVPLYAQPEDPAIKPVSYNAVINDNPENAAKDRISLNGTDYYYNGANTMKKKTALALNYGFGGMMIWEVGHDAKGRYSLTGMIAEVLQNTEEPVKYYSLKNAK